MTHYDLLALGEVMLRLDPGECRVRNARNFTACEGGGEYNVARSLNKCFGLKTGLISGLVDNEVGRLIEDLIHQGNVDMRYLKWVTSDGIGVKVRNGLNFTERGFGLRPARGCVDRGHSAASQLRPGDFDFAEIFSANEIRWLHTGGIFAALSDSTFSLTSEACRLAREHGMKVSYDLNYRASLWRDRGGFRAARELNRKLLPHVDVVFGALTDEEISVLESSKSKDLFAREAEAAQIAFGKMRDEFPNLQFCAATLRRVHSASCHDWGGIASAGGEIYRSRDYPNVEVLDRIGAGDAFAAGVIFGLLNDKSPQTTLEIAAAHGALTMTTPGDASFATLPEVMRLAEKSDARIVR